MTVPTSTKEVPQVSAAVHWATRGRLRRGRVEKSGVRSDALGLTMPASRRACLLMGRDADKIGGGLVLDDEYNVVLGPLAHGYPKAKKKNEPASSSVTCEWCLARAHRASGSTVSGGATQATGREALPTRRSARSARRGMDRPLAGLVCLFPPRHLQD